MMEYSTRIEDYLNAIQGCDSFIVAEREYGRIINYIQMGNDVFPYFGDVIDPDIARKLQLRRQCRGLIFNLNGDIISVPYHKFFNVGERFETLLENIDMSRPHVILEKLDGSMIRLVPIGDAYRMGTKMGLTEVAMQSEVFIAANPNYDKFIRAMMDLGYTTIFEWCSRTQRIVIDYPRDRLVLTAMRKLDSGKYMSYTGLCIEAAAWQIEVVRAYDGTVENMETLLAETAGLQGQEGWVIRFGDNGEMLKIKAEEYVLIHKAKANILREKGVIEMILEERIDDVKAFLPIEDRERLDNYETAFWHGVSETAQAWAAMNDQVHSVYEKDRKGFALGMSKELNQSLRGTIFQVWDDIVFDWRSSVLNAVSKHLSTQTKIDEARHLWGGVEWVLPSPETNEDR